MYHYQFNIGDYRKDTAHLTIMEHGVYRLLLDTYYATELPLPLDIRHLARMHCLRSSDEKAALDVVLDDFFEKTDEGYRHHGCEKVMAKVYEKSEKARLSAQKKWEREKAKKCERIEKECERMESLCECKKKPCEHDATDMLPVTRNPKPVTRNPIKPLSAHADVVVSVFDHWRSRMGHPAAKLDDKRRRLITTALKIGYTPGNLCAAIDGCALSPHHMGQNDRSTRYDSLDLILRNADKIDWFIAMTEQNQGFVGKHTDRSWRDGIDGPVANAEAQIERDPSVVATVVAGESENAKQGAL